MRRSFFFILILLCFSFSISIHIAKSQSFTKSIVSVGKITYNERYGLGLKYAIDFEDAVKVNDNHLNLQIDHYFNLGAPYGDGAYMQVEEDFAHSGSRCIGMELFDIARSRRAAFSITNAQDLLGDEIFVSMCLYLPSDWMLYGPDGLRWYAINMIFAEPGEPYYHYLELHIKQPIINVPEFNVYLFLRKHDGSTQTFGHTIDFPLPRGRWFKIEYYLLRHETDGVVKLWMDDILICDQTGLATHGGNNMYDITPAKIYYDLGDEIPHQIWVDDLEIWSH